MQAIYISFAGPPHPSAEIEAVSCNTFVGHKKQ